MKVPSALSKYYKDQSKNIKNNNQEQNETDIRHSTNQNTNIITIKTRTEAQSGETSAMIPSQERKTAEERVEPKIEKIWKQLEKELEDKWLIVETDNESKRTVRTFTLITILQIITQHNIVNKYEWTLLVKAHLEKLIEMGHGNKELEVKIYFIPNKSEKARQDISVLRKTKESITNEMSTCTDSYDELDDDTLTDTDSERSLMLEQVSEKLRYLLKDDETKLNLITQGTQEELFNEQEADELSDKQEADIKSTVRKEQTRPLPLEIKEEKQCPLKPDELEDEFKSYLERNYPEITLGSIEAKAHYPIFLEKKQKVDKLVEELMAEADSTEEQTRSPLGSPTLGNTVTEEEFQIILKEY